MTWNNTSDLNNTWTDILEGCTKISWITFNEQCFLSLDDQPEINEYLRYQRTIRELKDENSHLRDEMANLRKTFKSQQPDKTQVY